jgi:hypothetical protein
MLSVSGLCFQIGVAVEGDGSVVNGQAFRVELPHRGDDAIADRRWGLETIIAWMSSRASRPAPSTGRSASAVPNGSHARQRGMRRGLIPAGIGDLSALSELGSASQKEEEAAKLRDAQRAWGATGLPDRPPSP